MPQQYTQYDGKTIRCFPFDVCTIKGKFTSYWKEDGTWPTERAMVNLPKFPELDGDESQQAAEEIIGKEFIEFVN